MSNKDKQPNQQQNQSTNKITQVASYACGTDFSRACRNKYNKINKALKTCPTNDL